jgi:adenosylcobinamide kinase/adenosylcobinamide-phosphate guanylyltransferase
MAALLPRLTLVLGGARSGKSRYAEELVRKHPAPWVYIATAEALDDEMRFRIAEHAARRGDGWTTVEAPLALGDAVAAHGASNRPILVDCLTLWLSNIMLSGKSIPAEYDRLYAALSAAKSPVVVVTNEVGLGIVPESKLGRDFRDAQGRLNAEVAALADHVVFMAAGLPLIMKQP